jgi:cyclopropane-fatty-acyl-phospholipid synthase
MSPPPPRSYFSDRTALRFPRRASLSARFLRRLLERFDIGRISVQLPDGEIVDWAGRAPGPQAVLVLHRWRAVRRLVFGGRLGFAEAYMDGEWSSPDLANLIEYAALNQDSAEAALAGTRFHRLLARLQHFAHANTKTGSKRNIVAHYDLGNDFYAAWLDGGMTYSSALFTEPDMSLERAQEEKQARVLQALGLSGGERVLEIGIGWGGLAERLIREARCHVTGVTLSPAQLAHAKQRLSRSDLVGKHDLRLQDYRDVRGVFDRIVSIEMLEAVGAEYWPIYFARLRECLADGGRAVLQVITIAEHYCESYRREPDFIQRHIFPGGMLPSVAELRSQIEQAGFVLQAAENFGASYAATLREWQYRFQIAWPKLSFQGFDEKFKRKWEYYLAYCEAGFRAGSIDVGIYELTRAAGAAP